MIDNPKFYESTQKQLGRLQRSVVRKKKGSNHRRKAVLKLKEIHLRIRNLRNEFLHQETTKLIKKFDVIYIEKLNVLGLAKGILAKQVNDASWSKFFNLLNYKAVNADKKVVEVNPNGTSQICSDCFVNVPKDLSVRTHHCHQCGLILDRDINAARNILRLGLRLLESTKAVTL
jgi:putative transposase